MIFPGRIICLGAAAILTVGVVDADDEPSEIPASVPDLLAAGWKSSSEAYPMAEKAYEQLRKTSPEDPRVPFAMALVAIKRQRQRDAQTYLAEALAESKVALPIRRTKIWIDVLRKDHAAVQADIKEMAGVLAADEASAAQQDFQQAARWLGCVMGYYAGPVKGELKPAEWDALDAEVSARLKGPLADALAQGKQSTSQQFTQTLDQLSAARKDAGARNQAKLEIDRKNAADDLATLEEKLKQNQDAYDQFEKEHGDEIRQKHEEWNTLGGRIADKKRDVQSAQKDLDHDDKKDKLGADQDEAKLRLLKMEQKQLEQQAAAMHSAIDQMEAPIKPVVRQLEQQRIMEKLLMRKMSQLAKPASEDDATTLVLAAKANSINNYAEVNLDEEKKRILDSYSAK